MADCWELWLIWQTGRERMEDLERWPYWRIAQAVDLIMAEAEQRAKDAQTQ